MLLLICVLVMAPGVLAHGAVEEITSFKSRIDISEENIATIKETIDYDFGSNQRHGIFRFIPLRTKAEGFDKYYLYKFRLISVSVDKQQVPIEQYREGDFQVLKIGDANKTIAGKHTYEIEYEIHYVVEETIEGDYFNWNLTGNNWLIPIEQFSGEINFPDSSGIIAGRCYSGATGEADQECRVEYSGSRVQVVNHSTIGVNEGITINILLNTGIFTNYLAPESPPLHERLPILGFLWGGILIITATIVRIWLSIRHRRLQKQETVVPQYIPPKKLSPGEIGLLNDNRADMTEITATIIDLAVRGYIRIEQTEAKKLFRKAKYRINKEKEYRGDSSITKIEENLLKLLFTDKDNSVMLDDITSEDAVPVIQDAKKSFNKSLENHGFYIRPAERRKRWHAAFKLSGFVGLGFLALNIFTVVAGGSLDLAIFSVLSAVFSPVIAWLIIKRTELTEAGYDQWADIQGFKMYLTVAEKDRLKFHNAPEKNAQLFSSLLPFAIALGVEKDWAKQFSGIDVLKDTGNWYIGTDVFSAGVLASSLSSDFGGAVSSNLTPTQSSGGFSGGGSAGGGGGGGGGGSW